MSVQLKAEQIFQRLKREQAERTSRVNAADTLNCKPHGESSRPKDG